MSSEKGPANDLGEDDARREIEHLCAHLSENQRVRVIMAALMPTYPDSFVERLAVLRGVLRIEEPGGIA